MVGTRTADQSPHSSTKGMPPILQLRKVYYAYPDGQEALIDVSLGIDRGDRVALLGASGSGKSTLLRLLGGLVAPSRGSLVFRGDALGERDHRGSSLAARLHAATGFVFQSSESQLFCPTVREELAYAPLQTEMSLEEVQARIQDVAALLGIGHLLNRAPFHLSGGEKRKVSLATALMLNPEVLLLDEPTSGLDPRTQAQLVEVLDQLHLAGKAIVTATHDLSLAARLADRCVILGEDHRMTADLPSQEALAHTDMLLSVNLVHPNSHWHGELFHTHTHTGTHDHSGSHAVD